MELRIIETMIMFSYGEAMVKFHYRDECQAFTGTMVYDIDEDCLDNPLLVTKEQVLRVVLGEFYNYHGQGD